MTRRCGRDRVASVVDRTASRIVYPRTAVAPFFELRTSDEIAVLGVMAAPRLLPEEHEARLREHADR
jgi:hypothetical protein